MCRLYERLCVMFRVGGNMFVNILCLFNAYIYIKYLLSIEFHKAIVFVTKVYIHLMGLIFFFEQA